MVAGKYSKISVDGRFHQTSNQTTTVLRGTVGAECSNLKERIYTHSAVIAWQSRAMEFIECCA